MDPTLKLLTLINVSAAKPGKRQRSSNLTHYDKITRKAAAAQQATASTSKVALSSTASPSKRAKNGAGSVATAFPSKSGVELVGEESDDEDELDGTSTRPQSSRRRLRPPPLTLTLAAMGRTRKPYPNS